MIDVYVEGLSIDIGRQGENLAKNIYFDLSELINTYGEGTATLVHMRPSDKAPYVCAVTRSDTFLIWAPTSTDTSYAGAGKCELRWVVGDVLAKSIVYRTFVAESITGDSVVPSEYESWYEALLEHISEYEIASDQIETNAENIATNTNDIAVLDGRVDELTTLPEGSTTGDAELADIRVGADGTVYNNAGDAVRGQVSDLKSIVSLINDGYYSFSLIPNVYINRDNGNELTSNGWSATDFIEVPSNSLILYYGTANLVWGAKYDAEKAYVSSATWNTQFNSFFNDTGSTIFFRTSGSNADMASIKFRILPAVDVSLAKTGYPADAKTVGDRLSTIESNGGVVPSYYKTQLAAKEAIIRGHFDDCAYNGDGLIFLTDTHFSTDLFTSATPTSSFNANNCFALIADIFKKCAIDKIAFGGDLVNSAPDIDTMLLCMASFGSRFGNRQSRLRYCVGNHEYYTGNDYGQTSKPTPEMLYGAGVKYNEDIVLGKGDMVTYYFDNALQKIRYFVVSCGRDTEVTIPQVEWVLSEFKNIPSGYHVVLIGHGFMTDAMTGFRGRYQQIANAFDKVKSKSSIFYNGTLYDYSALDNVTPVCMITGHTHIDGSLTTSGGIPCICTTTDSYAQNYELVDGTPTKVPRTKGTTNEQAFDVIQFDFSNRKIYCTRIGYGSDREFSY